MRAVDENLYFASIALLLASGLEAGGLPRNLGIKVWNGQIIFGAQLPLWARTCIGDS